MEPLEETGPIRTPSAAGAGESVSRRSRSRRRSARAPFLYRLCDGLTEGLIYFMVIFTPWSFGTTQQWSIWTMNVTGYVLGVLLVFKGLIRWRTGGVPNQSGRKSDVHDAPRAEPSHTRAPQIITFSLAALTVLVLAYCLMAALNYRAVFLPREFRFEYHDFIAWLPHSYDAASTWAAFWKYLGLACFFWALRDWLLGKTNAERSNWKRRSRDTATVDVAHADVLLASEPIADVLPSRLRRLLWVLCINGALLALEGILQRLDGTNKLLWLVLPRINNTAATQFGPYAYRSNAATYFNLLWPVCFGFWLILRRATNRVRPIGGRIGEGSYVLLLPCAVLMAVAPMITASRGGALIAFANMLAVAGLLFFAMRHEASAIRASVLSLVILVLALAGYLGWKQLAERLEVMFIDQLSLRTVIYRNARPIAKDFPLFGTGAGTFGHVYYLYRNPGDLWDAYAHDDYLETRITFGWVGFCLLMLMLVMVLVRWFFPGGIRASIEFAATIWLALIGCLVHAKFDFPFQVYSLLFLFLLLCSVLSCLSRKI